MMIAWRVFLLILISIVGQESDASSTGYFRKFRQGYPLETDSIQTSPSPTPASPSPTPASFPVEPPASTPVEPPASTPVEPPASAPAEPPKLGTLVKETCDKVQFTCRDDINNMTACLLSAVNGKVYSTILHSSSGKRQSVQSVSDKRWTKNLSNRIIVYVKSAIVPYFKVETIGSQIGTLVCNSRGCREGAKGSILLVHNDGGRDLKLNITVLPTNDTYDNKKISRHRIKKIKIPSNISGSSSIILNAGNGHCIISLGASAPLEKLFKGYATPVNAAYLLFGTIVIIGGTCACCLTKSKGRHLDGVPYQELEMGQKQQQQQQQKQQSLPHVDVETADNWDQSWDDDWDEEKAVRSSGGSRLKRIEANGFSSRLVNTNDQGND